MRAAGRWIGLVFFTGYALACVYAAVVTVWLPAGSVGLSTDFGATVRAVAPGSPAARAGIVPGDRVRLDATPFADRAYVSGPGTSVPIGRSVHVAYVHAGRAADARLTAVPKAFGSQARVSRFVQIVASLAFVIVGAGLIVLRPGAATWGFGLYCLLDLPAAVVAWPIGDARWALVATLAYDVLQNVGVAGLVLFALEFPRPFAAPWRERIRRSLPALFVVLSALTLYPDVANQLLARGARIENDVLQLAFGAVYVLCIAILFDTFRRVARDERERLRWVLVGFCAGLLVSYAGTTIFYSTLIAFTPPIWLSITIVSFNVALPLAIAHAVLRHHVLDVQFVIRRALIFALLTFVLAVVFALCEYAFSELLGDLRLSRVAGAAVAIALAFAFKWIEEGTGSRVEAIFFRKRRAAEERLARAAESMRTLPSDAAIEAVLVDEAAATLDLASAAVFRDDGNGRFTRRAARGWSAADPYVLDGPAVPSTAAQPVLAVPFGEPGAPRGFTLYGTHRDGGDVEPGEQRLLERLGAVAGHVLEQLELRRLRAEIAELRRAP